MTGLRTSTPRVAKPRALNVDFVALAERRAALGEVGARAERRRRPGQHDGSYGRVGVAAAVRVGELVAHAVTERVALRRPVNVMVATPSATSNRIVRYVTTRDASSRAVTR